MPMEALTNYPKIPAWDRETAAKIISLFPWDNDPLNPNFSLEKVIFFIQALQLSEMEKEFWDKIGNCYQENNNVSTIISILQSKLKD